LTTIEATMQSSLAWTGGELRIAGATDVGRVRRVNQDAYGYFRDDDRDEVLLVVADGLGGHRGGEVASVMAVEVLASMIRTGNDDPGQRLKTAIEAANRQILEVARDDRALEGMGTTIVCLLLANCRPSVVAHVGDSRLYRLRDEAFTAITEDHSLVATLLREGILSEEEASQDPRRNQILRALGVRDEVEVEVAEIHPAGGDRYLLCSDGLHGRIDDVEMKRLMIGVEDEPLKAASDLIAAANAAGGHDNITCLIASLPESTLFPALRAGGARLIETTKSLFRRSSDE
jgi:protein phosphatase